MYVKDIILSFADERGWTFDMLASQMSLNKMQLEQKLENGADIEFVYKICEVFGITIDALYSRYQKQKKIVL